MKIRCHGCSRQFRVRQDRLPSGGAKTRCPRCNEVLVIPPREEAAPARPAAPPIAAANDSGDLFDLPPTELELLSGDDMFELAGPASSTAADGDGHGSEPTSDTVQEAVPPAPQEDDLVGERPSGRGGLRGWLGRLFGRDL